MMLLGEPACHRLTLTDVNHRPVQILGIETRKYINCRLLRLRSGKKPLPVAKRTGSYTGRPPSDLGVSESSGILIKEDETDEPSTHAASPRVSSRYPSPSIRQDQPGPTSVEVSSSAMMQGPGTSQPGDICVRS